MASILDLRRRIRSVKSTRQITRAMKMIAAAKLRRAQERAISSRPYAAMLASVLESLKRRIEIYDPETGELRHPLLKTREEKRVLIVVVSGDKGFAGGFNANIIKAATQFIDHNGDKEIDVEPVGRKSREFMRRRYPAAKFVVQQEENARAERQRSNRIEMIGDHPGILDKVDFERVSELGEEIAARYTHEEIDAAYIVYNEFKSVIAQRLADRQNMRLVEGVVERRAAMARGAERHPLRGNCRIGLAREIGRHQPRNIGEHGRRDRFAGQRMDVSHGIPLEVVPRHGRVYPGHPRLPGDESKTWMRGSSPRMTKIKRGC